jgi:hypothetical protein
MKMIIGAKWAANALLIGLGGLAGFHILLLMKVFPATVAWGGRVSQSSTDFIVLELIGLTVIALFAVIVASKIGYLKLMKQRQLVNIGVWVICGYFALNILGNLASMSGLERAIFTPVSFVLALLALRLGLEK